MAFTTEKKAKILDDHKTHTGDTGSPEVQVALLSAHIEDLAAHFQAHPKDHHSRLGLLKMNNKRRSLLDYLRTASSNRYRALVERLGLRK